MTSHWDVRKVWPIYVHAPLFVFNAQTFICIFIAQPLNPNVAANGWSYFHYEIPAPAEESVFPYDHEELLLTNDRHLFGL
jgi:hypothetical protein